MGIVISGDENSSLRRMLRRADALNGKQTVVSWEQMFSPAFLAEKTNFTSLEDMFSKSGFEIKTPEDFRAIPRDLWEQFITANTSYESWAAFRSAARQHHIREILKSESPLPEMTAPESEYRTEPIINVTSTGVFSGRQKNRT